MKLRRLLILLVIACGVGGGAWWWIRRAAEPAPTYWLSIDQHFQYQGPTSVPITAYKRDDTWLWYRTPDGLEYTISVQGRNIIIASGLTHETLTEDERRANVNGVGGAGK